MIDEASGSPYTEEMIARITDPLGDLPALCPSAIFWNVQQAARVFERPPAPRLTSVRNELKNARKRYKGDPAQHVDLSEEARLYVRVPDIIALAKAHIAEGLSWNKRQGGIDADNIPRVIFVSLPMKG